MDLKKEIKLSDLFKRKPKEASAAAEQVEAAAEKAEKKSALKKEINLSFRRRGKERAASAAPAAEGSDKKSGLKKEINLSFRRRAKDPDFDVGPAKPKRQKGERRRKRGDAAAGSEAVPAIPLMRAFNLLPKEDARQAASRRPSTAQLVLAVVGLVLIAGLASMFLISNARVADKEQELAALEEQLAAKQVPLEEPTSTVGSDAALVQERDGRTGALGTALGGRTAWDRLLRDLSLVLPDDVWLQSLTGSSATAAPTGEGAPPPDPNAVAAATTFEVNGYTRRHEGVAQFLSRLQVLPEIESATLVSATKTKVGDEMAIQFVLRATVKPHVAGGGA